MARAPYVVPIVPSMRGAADAAARRRAGQAPAPQSPLIPQTPPGYPFPGVITPRASGAGRQTLANSGASRTAPRDLSPRIPVMDGEEVMPIWPGGPVGVVFQTHESRAARATGVPREYLDALMGQESGGEASADHARAGTSSATGRAQFEDATWMSYLERQGRRYGLDPSSVDKRTALGLRHDAEWSSVMAGELARDNYAVLRRQLRRDNITNGQVYLAHFINPTVASTMILASEEDARRGGRGRLGIDFAPEAAIKANHNVFYDERDRPRTVSEVVARQTRLFRGVFSVGERGFTPPEEPDRSGPE